MVRYQYTFCAQNLWFDQESLVDLYQQLPEDGWKQREDRLGNPWAMDENRDFPHTHPFVVEILNNIRPRVDSTQMYFSRVHSGGMPNHSDYHNFTKLQFPVICDGTWSETPLLILDKFDQVIESCFHEQSLITNQPAPILYACNQLHGTFKEITNTDQRVTFVIDIDTWHERAIASMKENSFLVKQGEFLKQIIEN